MTGSSNSPAEPPDERQRLAAFADRHGMRLIALVVAIVFLLVALPILFALLTASPSDVTQPPPTSTPAPSSNGQPLDLGIAQPMRLWYTTRLDSPMHPAFLQPSTLGRFSAVRR